MTVLELAFDRDDVLIGSRDAAVPCRDPRAVDVALLVLVTSDGRLVRAERRAPDDAQAPCVV